MQPKMFRVLAFNIKCTNVNKNGGGCSKGKVVIKIKTKTMIYTDNKYVSIKFTYLYPIICCFFFNKKIILHLVIQQCLTYWTVVDIAHFDFRCQYHQFTSYLKSLSHFLKIKLSYFLGNEFLVKMSKLLQNYTFKIDDTISKIMYLWSK